ncbi:MAG: InlB B-repeat-containing protein, partial [Parabacteroides sp.]|nr:InlB B-repeat-containing protein [Parabacteroides sp.]
MVKCNGSNLIATRLRFNSCKMPYKNGKIFVKRRCKRMKKRILSLLLSVCVIVSGLPLVTFAVEPDNNNADAAIQVADSETTSLSEEENNAEASATHNGHCTCVGSDICVYAEDGITPITGSILPSGKHTCTTGHIDPVIEDDSETYYHATNAADFLAALRSTNVNRSRISLSNDITLYDINIKIRGNKTICLNGFNLKYDSSANLGARLFYLEPNSTLTICDCKGTGSIDGNNKIGGFFVIGKDSIDNVEKKYSSTLNIFSGTIKNFKANNPGGAICNDGETNIYGGNIINNTSGNNNGGGLYLNDGVINMYGGIVSGNTTADPLKVGGGVYVEGDHDSGVFNFYGGQITSNTAYKGAGVYVAEGEFNILKFENADKCANFKAPVISGNNAVPYEKNVANYGGGVYLEEPNKNGKSKFTMECGSISGNTAYRGGGVYSCGTFEMNGGSISGNTAIDKAKIYGYGGGVNIYDGDFTMTAGEISKNNAQFDGGGIYIDHSGVFTMKGGKVDSNTASYGAGVYIKDSDEFYLIDGEITNNTAVRQGGGVYVRDSATLNMTGGIISKNTATSSSMYPGEYGGGGIHVYADQAGDQPVVNISGGVISENKTLRGNGGGINLAIADARLNMSGGEIINNASSSTGNGGGIASIGTCEITGGLISGNTAKDGAGINVHKGSLIISGGEISGNKIATATLGVGAGVNVVSGASIYLSGTAKVVDNKAGNDNSNIYLTKDNYIKLFGEDFTGTAGVTVEGVKTSAQPGVVIAKGAELEGKDNYVFNPENAVNFVYDYEIDAGNAKSGKNLYKVIPNHATFILDCMHAVTLEKGENSLTDTKPSYGTLVDNGTVKDKDGNSLFYSGDTVEFKTTIAMGEDNYAVYDVDVVDANGVNIKFDTISSAPIESSYSFTMPALYDAKVTLDFSKVHKINVVQPENGKITPEKLTARPGETVNVVVEPNPEYHFVSLKCEQNGIPLASVMGTSFIMPAGDVTLTAELKHDPSAEATYSVNYLENGGSGLMKNDQVKAGLFVLPTTCDFTAPEGYVFKGWSKEPDGLVVNSVNVTGNTSVYAIWAAEGDNSHTVTFDANGGNGAMDPIIVDAANEVIDMPVCGFEAPEGKEFAGWSDSADGEIVEGEQITIKQDVTLYAIWKDVIPDEPDEPSEP